MEPASAIYRSQSCGEWRALRQLSARAQLVWGELFWGDDSTRTGLVRCSVAMLGETLTLPTRGVRQALDELSAAGLIRWSESDRLALRLGYIESNFPTRPNQIDSWRNELSAARDCELSAQAREMFARKESLNRPLNDPLNGSQRNKGTKVHDLPSGDRRASAPSTRGSESTGKEAGPKTASRRVTVAQKPPTLDETRAVFASIGCDGMEVADSCHDHYLKVGWVTSSGRPLFDWLATCRGWLRNEPKFQGNRGNVRRSQPSQVSLAMAPVLTPAESAERTRVFDAERKKIAADDAARILRIQEAEQRFGAEIDAEPDPTARTMGREARKMRRVARLLQRLDLAEAECSVG